MKFLSYLSAAALTLSGLSASAQAQKPIVEKPIAGSEVILNGMSNNGKWAVAQSGSTTDGDLRPVGGVIFNMENFEQTPISHPSGLSGVSDITDDGSIVVGECNTKPGYWSKLQSAGQPVESLSYRLRPAGQEICGADKSPEARHVAP